jgi:hypothetical protein
MTTAPGMSVSDPAAAAGEQADNPTLAFRHQRRDRLRGNCGQGLRQEQFDPGEHEAEEAGDTDSCSDGRHEDAEEEAWE